MNSLSWLIYIAGAVGSIGAFLKFLIAATAFVAFIAGFGAIYTYANGYPEKSTQFRRCMVRFSTGFVILGMFTGLIPSRETMMMIAASEMGQRVVASEKVAGVVDPTMDLLKAWIKHTTADLYKSACDTSPVDNKCKE